MNILELLFKDLLIFNGGVHSQNEMDYILRYHNISQKYFSRRFRKYIIKFHPEYEFVEWFFKKNKWYHLYKHIDEIFY